MADTELKTSRLTNYYSSKNAPAPEVINSDILAIIAQLKDANDHLKFQNEALAKLRTELNEREMVNKVQASVIESQDREFKRALTDAEDDAASERARSAELEEEMERYKSELLTLAATIMTASSLGSNAKGSHIKTSFVIAHEAKEIIKRVFPDGVNLS